jgi:hypothetical protein
VFVTMSHGLPVAQPWYVLFPTLPTKKEKHSKTQPRMTVPSDSSSPDALPRTDPMDTPTCKSTAADHYECLGYLLNHPT